LAGCNWFSEHIFHLLEHSGSCGVWDVSVLVLGISVTLVKVLSV